MATKLTIWIEDGMDGGDAIASAISSLQHDRFEIITWELEEDIGINRD